MPAITKTTEKSFYALALARISLGLIFLWAFFDKLFGLGFTTCKTAAMSVVHTGCSQAWLQGGSPTVGFLKHATKGPFASLFRNLAGHSWVDYLFMAGLLAIGVGLLLGIGVKLSVWAGSVMLLLMWAASLWPANNPLLDEHIVYIFVLVAIGLANAQQKWGLRDWWLKQPVVRNLPLLE